MNSFKKWINNHWWMLAVCLIVIYIVFVSIINIPELNRITNSIFTYLNIIITPLGIILGIILGYPLLKDKLVDSYITKQFDIIHNNNRKLRRECLRLKEKYPIKHISENLTSDFLSILVEDIKRLNEIAIDASPDAYRYSYLVYKGLLNFQERTRTKIPHNYKEGYYKETLSSFVNEHIKRVFQYTRVVNFTSKTNKVQKKSILAPKLKEYTTDNQYIDIENIDYPFSYRHNSALLVIFFGNNNITLNSKNGLLFESCYLAAPSPNPFARLMYNREIYMPPIITGENFLEIFKSELRLVGFTGERSVEIESGVKKSYIIFQYANISSHGFVKGHIKNQESLEKYRDSYLNREIFDVSNIEVFHINGESIIIKIEEVNIRKYFVEVKRDLEKKMKEEMKF